LKDKTGWPKEGKTELMSKSRELKSKRSEWNEDHLLKENQLIAMIEALRDDATVLKGLKSRKSVLQLSVFLSITNGTLLC